MGVAETEGIPIHAYVFTPGGYPLEDYPGAAQQIARNIYEMAGLTVPLIAVFFRRRFRRRRSHFPSPTSASCSRTATIP